MLKMPIKVQVLEQNSMSVSRPKGRDRAVVSAALRPSPCGSRPFGLPSHDAKGREEGKALRGRRALVSAEHQCSITPYATCARCPGVAHWFQRSTSCVGKRR